MTKYFILCLTAVLLITSENALASEALIYNMSEQHDMLVFYKLCKNHDTTPNCTSMKEVTIKRKQYLTLKPLPNLDNVVINSAVEKDQCGNVISKGEYWYNTDTSSCHANMVEGVVTYAGIIVLNDMHESPYILCTTEFRQVHSHK